ncbi:MAG: HAMP domain-containing sensor histidine kinase, partial [Gammaproteobacteria bacterium]|nr:HAMP domain-containing sensor histidine kinase [Gammaproteobacteria bacterium]
LNAMSAATRIEQSIQSSEKEPVDLSALVDSCIDGYRLANHGKSIELSGQNEGTHVLGCPELLSQLLDKLMENACDFCSTEGTILVGLKRQDKWAVLTVENDGPELPAGMSGNLFESMVSVRDDSGKQAHMGLGLTIVRLIAEYHEGTSLAANRDDGSGVRFTVTVPLG